MKNTVVLRRNKNHRALFGVFTALMFAAITICVIYLKTFLAFVLYLPFVPFVIPVWRYFSWQLRFDEKNIVQKVCFQKAKRYSYAQLQKITQRHYSSENTVCVCMHFADQKKIRFRMDDDGAAQAVKMLQRHRSIHTA